MLKWLETIGSIAPLVMQFIPGCAPLAPYVSFGVQQAEKIPGASGAQKRDIAIAIAKAGVGATNALKGSTLIDPAISDETIGATVDAVVGITNIVHKAQAQPAAAPVG